MGEGTTPSAWQTTAFHTSPKETRRCCHHGRVGSKALTSGEELFGHRSREVALLSWLLLTLSAGVWKEKKKKTAKRLVLVRQSGSSCTDVQNISQKFSVFRESEADGRAAVLEGRLELWKTASDTDTRL